MMIRTNGATAGIASWTGDIPDGSTPIGSPRTRRGPLLVHRCFAPDVDRCCWARTRGIPSCLATAHVTRIAISPSSNMSNLALADTIAVHPDLARHALRIGCCNESAVYLIIVAKSPHDHGVETSDIMRPSQRVYFTYGYRRQHVSPPSTRPKDFRHPRLRLLCPRRNSRACDGAGRRRTWAGLVRRTVVGRRHLVRLEPGPLAAASAWRRFYERFWAERLPGDGTLSEVGRRARGKDHREKLGR